MEEGGGSQWGRNLKVKWELYVSSPATPSDAAQQVSTFKMLHLDL